MLSVIIKGQKALSFNFQKGEDRNDEIRDQRGKSAGGNLQSGTE